MSKLIAIVGPTASGKSGLALEVAKRWAGEIICADSRTVYRGMDIGTAKPTMAEQAEVPHHLLDLIDPDETYSAAQFKAAALESIKEIESRGHRPILVGGSGLYLYSVLYDYDFPAGADSAKRQKLNELPLEKLVGELQRLDLEAAEAIDLRNKRRVIRAIETAGQPKQKSQLVSGAILIGLRPPDMDARIAARTDEMIQNGLEAEVQELVKRYGPDLESLRSPGYAEVVEDIQEPLLGLSDLIDLHTRQLAKRQLTWFKRNPYINWFASPPEALKFIEQRV